MRACEDILTRALKALKTVFQASPVGRSHNANIFVCSRSDMVSILFLLYSPYHRLAGLPALYAGRLYPHRLHSRPRQEVNALDFQCVKNGKTVVMIFHSPS